MDLLAALIRSMNLSNHDKEANCSKEFISASLSAEPKYLQLRAFAEESLKTEHSLSTGLTSKVGTNDEHIVVSSLFR